MWEDPVIYHSLDKNGAFNNLFIMKVFEICCQLKFLKKSESADHA